jgi:hypothetical protein
MFMAAIERRTFVKGAALGALAFTIGDTEVLLTPKQAKAQSVPLRTLKPEEAEALEAMGETLVPGAKAGGIANFVDQQISGPADEALLQARILNVRPPYAISIARRCAPSTAQATRSTARSSDNSQPTSSATSLI